MVTMYLLVGHIDSTYFVLILGTWQWESPFFSAAPDDTAVRHHLCCQCSTQLLPSHAPAKAADLEVKGGRGSTEWG